MEKENKEEKDIYEVNKDDLIKIKSIYDFGRKDLTHYTNKIKYDYFRNYNLIINMELLNGEFVTFMVKADYNGFKFRDKRYIIDTTLKYYSQTFKNYMLDFHEEYNLPIKRKINVKLLREGVKEKKLEVQNMLNPYILEQFVKSNLAEGILQGSSLNKIFDYLKIWVTIGAVASICVLLFLVYQSGLLQDLL
jgi:hypothetical protein